MATTEPKQRRTAGAFDVRMVIAALIGIYGLVLLGVGLFGASDADLDRAGGWNVNLWSGIGMIVVSVAFAAWTRWRPIVVPADPGPPRDDNGDSPE